MTIEFLPHDVYPSSPISWYQENFEAIERLFPLPKDWIESVWAGAIDWSDGTIVPIENLPVDELRDLLSDDGTLLTDLSYLTGLDVHYRDGITLLISPGQVAHRGKFKRQGLEEGSSTDYKQIDAASSLRDAAADASSPGNSGLDAEEWYYVYADTTTASTTPAFKISKSVPVNEDGHGLEHPSENTLRFIGLFQTGPTPDADIRPFELYENQRVMWREAKLGPYGWDGEVTNEYWEHTDNFITKSALDDAPPLATTLLFSAYVRQKSSTRIRITGDTALEDGLFFGSGDDDSYAYSWFEVPTNTLDSSTNRRRSDSSFDLAADDDDKNKLALVGFHYRR